MTIQVDRAEGYMREWHTEQYYVSKLIFSQRVRLEVLPSTYASLNRTTIFSGGMSALAAISGAVKALSTAVATSFLTAAVRAACTYNVSFETSHKERGD